MAGYHRYDHIVAYRLRKVDGRSRRGRAEKASTAALLRRLLGLALQLGLDHVGADDRGSELLQALQLHAQLPVGDEGWGIRAAAAERKYNNPWTYLFMGARLPREDRMKHQGCGRV